jgi:hypothetical protein
MNRAPTQNWADTCVCPYRNPTWISAQEEEVIGYSLIVNW